MEEIYGEMSDKKREELCPHGEDLVTEQTLNFIKVTIRTPGFHLDREGALAMYAEKLGWSAEEVDKYRKLLEKDGM